MFLAISVLVMAIILLIGFTVFLILQTQKDGYQANDTIVIIIGLFIIGFVFSLALRVTYVEGYGNPAGHGVLRENEVYQVIWDQQIELAQSDRIVRVKDRKGNYRIIKFEKSPPSPYFKVKKGKYLLFPPAE